jgi:hypothetical protein
MCIIGFLDLKNLCIDTKIMVIGALIADLWAKTWFLAAILNFQLFGGNRWSDILVPAIFEIGILKNPPKCKLSCFYPEVHTSDTYPPH